MAKRVKNEDFGDMSAQKPAKQQDAPQSSRRTARKSDFGSMREQSATDADFRRAAGIQMGRRRSGFGKKAVAFGVWTVVVSFLALTVLSALQVNNNMLLNVELRKTLETQYNPSFKTRYGDLGRSITEAWYNQNPSPSPVKLANGITWPHSGTNDSSDFQADYATAIANGVSLTPSMTVRNVTYVNGEQIPAPGEDGQYYEVNYYSAYIDGSLGVIAVTLGIADLADYGALPTLMSEPTILPNDGALGETISSTQPNWFGATATDNMKTQVNSWAKAYSENNSSALKQITGDSGKSFYIGAISDKGWKYVDSSAQIIWVKEKANDPDYAVAQVSWKMKLPDFEVVDPRDPQKKITKVGATQTQRMEILIKSPKSGLPLIVAWGPVGTFSILTPAMNSLTEEEFKTVSGFYRGGSNSEVESDVTPDDGGATPTSEPVSPETETTEPPATTNPSPPATDEVNQGE